MKGPTALVVLALASSLSFPFFRISACGQTDPTPTPTPEPTPLPTPPANSCVSSADCPQGQYCIGRPPLEGATGCCQSTARLPGEGESCTETRDCASGLVCIAESCSPAWMADSFTRSPGLAIPDGDSTGLEDRMLVSCLATVPVDASIDLRIDHGRIGDLVVTITDPGQEMTTVLHDRTGGDADVLELKGAKVLHSGDNAVNGHWVLVVKDMATGETGALTSWTLHLTSRWD